MKTIEVGFMNYLFKGFGSGYFSVKLVLINRLQARKTLSLNYGTSADSLFSFIVSTISLASAGTNNESD